MGDDGTIATFYLLEHTLEVLFGTKTVPVAKFRGTGFTDPGIPASFFASDRLLDHPDRPVNRLAAERVVLMVEIALAGQSGFDRMAMSRLVSGLTLEMFGVGCGELIILGPEDELLEVKVAAQLDLVRTVMAGAVGRERVVVSQVAELLREITGRAKHWPGAREARACDGGCACPWRGVDARLAQVAERNLIIPEKRLMIPGEKRLNLSLKPIKEGKVLMESNDDLYAAEGNDGGGGHGRLEAGADMMPELIEDLGSGLLWAEPIEAVGGPERYAVWYKAREQGR